LLILILENAVKYLHKNVDLNKVWGNIFPENLKDREWNNQVFDVDK
jgi:hypothetical protein